MTNQWKRTLSGIVVLAMLLSCAAVNVFAVTNDLTTDDFTLSVEQTGSLVTVKLTGTKEVTGWGGGSGTLSVKDAAGADMKSEFTLNSITTNVGDPNNSDSDWKWAATVKNSDTETGDTIAANTMWAQYTLTALGNISTGDYTFTMTFGNDNFEAGETPEKYTVANKTITTTKSLTFVKGYTVTLTDGVTGTAEINPGATFDMDVVVSGAGFNGMQAEIGYDAALFTLNSVSNISNYDDSTAGKVSMYLLSKDIVSSGTTVATLSFTAKDLPDGTDEQTGSFTIAKGTADDMAGFATQDAQNATLVGDAVKVANEKTYTVAVDSTITHGSVGVSATTANAGDTIEVTATPATGYELDTLTVTGDESGTDVTVTDGKFTMPAENVTVSATFTLKDYTVTLDGGDLSGATKANYGTDYVATVTNYDSSAYNYRLAVTIGGAEYKASIGEDGKITIPGNKIDGAIVITLTKTEKPFTVSTVDNYVTGATLVLVTGTNLSQYGYTYDGNPMFYVDRYNAYAYVVEGTANSSNVAAATSGTPTTIPTGYDVNKTGTVDFNDAGAAFGCYNVSYTIADHVELYLRADVTGDVKKVDAEDVSAIMSNYTTDSTASAEPNGEA